MPTELPPGSFQDGPRGDGTVGPLLSDVRQPPRSFGVAAGERWPQHRLGIIGPTRG